MIEAPRRSFHAERLPGPPEIPRESLYSLLVIDPSDRADVEALFALDKAVQRVTPHIYPIETVDEFLSSMFEKNETALTMALKDSENQQFMGYLAMYIDDNRPDTLEISSLAVSPDFQRRGCAHQLMVQAERLAQEIACTFLRLWVGGENVDAQSFYSWYGFKVVSRPYEPFGEEAGSRFLMIKEVGMQPIRWVYDEDPV